MTADGGVYACRHGGRYRDGVGGLLVDRLHVVAQRFVECGREQGVLGVDFLGGGQALGQVMSGLGVVELGMGDVF